KLENTEHATVEDMKAMQFDTYSSKAYDFIQMLQNIITLQDVNAKFRDTYDKLLKWDCHYKASYDIPVLFELFSDALEENTWDEISKLKETADVNYPEDWRLLELINSDPDNKYFDIRNTSHKENAKDIVIVSINQALDKFLTSKNNGKNMAWGAYKPLNFFHMTRIPALS
ncbi:MAG TPA: penicillin acylase family protein, partial [Saprospiraceae bacterium]|nr:penicillin acylase family protein [Saprospiraceae bacterium]